MASVGGSAFFSCDVPVDRGDSFSNLSAHHRGARGGTSGLFRAYFAPVPMRPVWEYEPLPCDAARHSTAGMAIRVMRHTAANSMTHTASVLRCEYHTPKTKAVSQTYKKFTRNQYRPSYPSVVSLSSLLYISHYLPSTFMPHLDLCCRSCISISLFRTSHLGLHSGF